MSKKTTGVLFLSALLCSQLIFAMGGSTVSGPMLDLNDGAGVVNAMENADVDRLTAILSGAKNQGLRLFATAALQRVTADIKSSTQTANRCYELARRSGDHFHAMACRVLSSGNALIVGDVSAWAAGIIAARKEFYSSFRSDSQPSATLAEFERLESYEAVAQLPSATQDFDMGLGRKTTFTQDIAAVPKGRSIRSRDPVFVKISIASGDATALVDTGAALTVAPVRFLAVTPGADRPQWMRPGVGGEDSLTAVGVLPTLRIGPSRFTNLAAVGTSAEVPIIVGLNALWSARRISFSERAIVFGDEGKCSRPEPLLLASSIDGNHPRLLRPIVVEGKKHLAFVDTGFDGDVENYVDTLPAENVMKFDELTPLGVREVSSSNEVKVIDGKAIRVRVRVDEAQRRGYLIGLGYAKSNQLVIDFERRFTCLGEPSKALQ